MRTESVANKAIANHKPLVGLRVLTAGELREIADRTSKSQIEIYERAVTAKAAMESLPEDVRRARLR